MANLVHGGPGSIVPGDRGWQESSASAPSPKDGKGVSGPTVCQGHVKFFSETKGFGFISVVIDGVATDVFVSATSITGNPLYQDDLVTFELDCNRKGKAAKNVRGGTGNPFKGKMKNAASQGKGGYISAKGPRSKFGSDKGSKSLHGPNFNSTVSDDEDESEWAGKANNGKGILPGGNHDQWFKGSGSQDMNLWSSDQGTYGKGPAEMGGPLVGPGGPLSGPGGPLGHQGPLGPQGNFENGNSSGPGSKGSLKGGSQQQSGSSSENIIVKNNILEMMFSNRPSGSSTNVNQVFAQHQAKLRQEREDAMAHHQLLTLDTSGGNGPGNSNIPPALPPVSSSSGGGPGGGSQGVFYTGGKKGSVVISQKDPGNFPLNYAAPEFRPSLKGE